MGKNGIKKLGKRDGAKDSMEYKDEGYLPEAMINYLALLGWHPSDDKELFTMSELIKTFEAERIQKAGAQWNDDKLNWINKEHIKKLQGAELENYIFGWLPKELQIKRIIPIIVERISKFGDIKTMVDNGELDFFYKKPEYKKEKLIYKNTNPEMILFNLEKVVDKLNEIDEKNFNKDEIKKCLNAISTEVGKSGEVLHPVRFALSGLDKSPDPFILAEILGKSETIARLNTAIKLLKL